MEEKIITDAHGGEASSSDALSDVQKRELEKDYPIISCYECGKRMLKPITKWAYKKSYKGLVRFFCSYTCMRKLEKRMEEEARFKRKYTHRGKKNDF